MTLAPTPRLPWRGGRGLVMRRHGGFILGYLMIALIILGILTAGLSQLRDEQLAARWVDAALATLRDNTQVARQQILLCAASTFVDAEAGDALALALPSSSEEGGLLEDVVCAGFGGEKLFDGSGTVFLPRPPQGFQPWRYLNKMDVVSGDDAGMVFIYTSTADANGIAAINRLSRNLSPDEHEVIRVGDTATLRFILRRPPSPTGG